MKVNPRTHSEPHFLRLEATLRRDLPRLPTRVVFWEIAGTLYGGFDIKLVTSFNLFKSK